VALLRASSQAIGEETDLEVSVRDVADVADGEGGLEHGKALAAFAESATRADENMAKMREDLIAAIGPEAFVEVAATVGIFNGLVRTADATGIPLDDGTLAASADFREKLGLTAFAGAKSSDLTSSTKIDSNPSAAKLFGM
jgi:hypothetical protein